MQNSQDKLLSALNGFLRLTEQPTEEWVKQPMLTQLTNFAIEIRKADQPKFSMATLAEHLEINAATVRNWVTEGRNKQGISTKHREILCEYFSETRKAAQELLEKRTRTRTHNTHGQREGGIFLLPIAEKVGRRRPVDRLPKFGVGKEMETQIINHLYLISPGIYDGLKKILSCGMQNPWEALILLISFVYGDIIAERFRQEIPEDLKADIMAKT